MTESEKDFKFLEIKKDLFNKILAGDYPNGSFIPTERTLAEIYNASRVTLRASLDLMEKEGYLSRVQGRGTMVTYNLGGNPSNLEMITLVNSYYGSFFVDFIRGLNKAAENHDSLVCFKERPKNENIFRKNGTIHNLLQKKIKNIIVWNQRSKILEKEMEIVRGLGTNMVFFDTGQNSPFADDLSLDNFHAIKTLGDHLKNCFKKLNKSKVIFIGTKASNYSTTVEREIAFDKYIGGPKATFEFKKKDFENECREFLKSIDLKKTNALLSANGFLAIEFKKMIFKEFQHLSNLKIVSIDNDDSSFMDKHHIDRIEQPYFQFGEKSFELLKNQSSAGSSWKSKRYYLKGKLLIAR